MKQTKCQNKPHNSFHETVVLADDDAGDRLMLREASEHLLFYQSRFFV